MLSEARLRLREVWRAELGHREVSQTDAYTDGFYDGRLWAGAKLMEQLGHLYINRVLDALEISDREAVRHSLKSDDEIR